MPCHACDESEITDDLIMSVEPFKVPNWYVGNNCFIAGLWCCVV